MKALIEMNLFVRSDVLNNALANGSCCELNLGVVRIDCNGGAARR